MKNLILYCKQKLIISKLSELRSLLKNLKYSLLNDIDKSNQGQTITMDDELILYDKIFMLNIEDIIKILLGQFLIILSAEDSENENTNVSRSFMLFDNLLTTCFLEEYKKYKASKEQLRGEGNIFTFSEYI